MIGVLEVVAVTALRIADAVPIARIAVDQLVCLERETDQKPVAAAVNQFHIVVAGRRPDGPGVEIDLDNARRRWLAIDDRSVTQVCLAYAECGDLRFTEAWQCPSLPSARNTPQLEKPSRNRRPRPATWIACARVPNTNRVELKGQPTGSACTFMNRSKQRRSRKRDPPKAPLPDQTP